jgi:hypothetical protein
MAHKFSDEAKEFEGGGNWFGFGVHEVTIGEITEGQTDGGTDYIEFTVLGDDGEEDTARVWLTEKAEKYSFNTLRSIYVHCAPEEAKDKARDSFDKAPDSTKVVEMMNDKCVGKKCWFTKYPDPTRTYQNSAGETKQSINKNIYGYEPKPRNDLLPKQDTVADVTGDETQDDIAAGIPSQW